MKIIIPFSYLSYICHVNQHYDSHNKYFYTKKLTPCRLLVSDKELTLILIFFLILVILYCTSNICPKPSNHLTNKYNNNVDTLTYTIS